MTNLSRLLNQQQSGFVWTPMQHIKKTLMALKSINGTNPNLTFIQENLQHFNANRMFWKKFGLKRRPSSGFYFVSVALALCTDVHVYGFWSFDTGPDGRAIPYHYYDKIGKTKAHNMSFEFRMMVAMHQLGLLHLHVDRCIKTSWTKVAKHKLVAMHHVIPSLHLTPGGGTLYKIIRGCACRSSIQIFSRITHPSVYHFQ